MHLGDQRASANGGARGGIGMGVGGLGIGGVVIAIIAAFMGFDPSVVLNTVEQMTPPAETQAPRKGGPPDEMQAFVSEVLGSTEDVWTAIFKQSNREYPNPQLVLFSGATRSGCGVGQAAIRPFYCPY